MDSTQSIHLLKPDELTPSHWQQWSDWVCAEPLYSSPYFRPEFTQAVAAVRDNVRIALFERRNQTIGFLPLQVNSQEIAYPVGHYLSDYHGIISPEELSFSPHHFLRGTGLKALYFDHLLTNTPDLESCSWGQSSSPYMDLSAGYEAYLAERKKSGSTELKNSLRKERKMARELGELRLVTNSEDPELFNRLMELKSAQYLRTSRPNVTGEPWVQETLQEIWRQQSDHFSGLLSALYAGEHLVAIHFGMLAGRELHLWFPAYEHEFHKYSPGLTLLLQLARSPELNLTRIDLGKGDEQYKHSFKSNVIDLWEGAIDSRSVPRWWNQKKYQTRQWTRTTPLGQHSLSVYRSVRATLKTARLAK